MVDHPTAVFYTYDNMVTFYWYYRDILHRDDGPAIVFDRSETWLKMGKIHRIDGPAYITPVCTGLVY